MHLLLVGVENAREEFDQRLVLQIVDPLVGRRDEELHPEQGVALEALATAALSEKSLQFLHLFQITRLAGYFITDPPEGVQLVVVVVHPFASHIYADESS